LILLMSYGAYLFLTCIQYNLIPQIFSQYLWAVRDWNVMRDRKSFSSWDLQSNRDWRVIGQWLSGDEVG
jgi:hypothetical protein